MSKWPFRTETPAGYSSKIRVRKIEPQMVSDGHTCTACIAGFTTLNETFTRIEKKQIHLAVRLCKTLYFRKFTPI